MKTEMPEGWEKHERHDRWDGHGARADVLPCTPAGWCAGAYGRIHADPATALGDALTLARALTPGWVVIEQSRIDVLESRLDAATAREEDLQRALNDRRANAARPHPILSRVRRLFGGKR